MKRMIALCLMCILHLFGVGQITVTNTMSPQELVQNVFLGPGVTVSSLTYNGDSQAAMTAQEKVGYFEANGTAFPINSGIVMSTGFVNQVAGASAFLADGIVSAWKDPDLFTFTDPYEVRDACVIEFDFIPNGNTVQFEFMFASEEYPEYVNMAFNDPFGFFISGPGINGTYSLGAENIALLPDGVTPITINNVNHLTNSQYYINNGFDYFGVTTRFDGYTILLNASAELQCGEVYHIKLAIGDSNDYHLDSAVFITAESFETQTEVNVELEANLGDTAIVEGCSSANLIFSRPAIDTNSQRVVYCTYSGSAIEGMDYNSLPDSLIFHAGEETVVLTVEALLDGMNEGNEDIIFSGYTVALCGDTTYFSDTLWVFDGPEARIELSIGEGCQPVEVVFQNLSLNGISYEWYFENGQIIQVNSTEQQTEIFESNSSVSLIVYDQYSCSDTTTVFVQVDICGCTDAAASNFNPLAIKDNGSCIFLNPEINAPNVFTPNNDGLNDIFRLKISNTNWIEFYIQNRWGNLVWSKTYDPNLEPDTGWDGRNSQGEPVTEGTYYYYYRATGSLDQQIEGHGFFQLVID